CTRNCPPANVSFRTFAQQAEPSTFSMIAQWYLDPDNAGENNVTDDLDDFEYSYEAYGQILKKASLLLSVWKSAIGDLALIPFNVRERKNILSHAHAKLDSYIKSDLSLEKQKTKRKRTRAVQT